LHPQCLASENAAQGGVEKSPSVLQVKGLRRNRDATKRLAGINNLKIFFTGNLGSGKEEPCLTCEGQGSLCGSQL